MKIFVHRSASSLQFLFSPSSSSTPPPYSPTLFSSSHYYSSSSSYPSPYSPSSFSTFCHVSIHFLLFLFSYFFSISSFITSSPSFSRSFHFLPPLLLLVPQEVHIVFVGSASWAIVEQLNPYHFQIV